MISFADAEAKYRKLRERMERGESISRAEFEEQVSQLAVQDASGTWWEIHPYTAYWMYYDGLQWIQGIPPGYDRSTVMPALYPDSEQARASTVARSAVQTPEQAGATRSVNIPGSVQAPLRAIRRRASPRSSNRTWIPFAVAAVLLFACSIIVFLGGQFVLGAFTNEPAPTQTAVVRLATPTAIPTIVQQPTLPLPTVTPSPVLAKIIEARVNVRAAPNLNGSIIGRVVRDDQITLIGRSNDGQWYRVTVAGIAEPSWIFGATMEITTGDPSSLPVVE